MNAVVSLHMAGLALCVGCAARDPAPPVPVPIEPPPTTNPPALPSWDDIASPHPPGATNPPRPALLVGPDGRCYKTWDSPMARGPRGDRRGTCDEAGGPCVEIVCDPVRRDAVREQP